MANINEGVTYELRYYARNEKEQRTTCQGLTEALHRAKTLIQNDVTSHVYVMAYVALVHSTPAVKPYSSFAEEVKACTQN